MDGLSKDRAAPRLRVQDLRTYFFTRRGVIKAVDGVSFTLNPGETLGLVGESGCGKSVTCLSILRLVPEPAGRIVGGQVLLNGTDLLQLSSKEMRRVRGRQVSMILQDPMTSLDPVYSIGEQVGEGIRFHLGLQGPALTGRVLQLLRWVRIPAPEVRVRDYPHQMSGGMRQRIVGAVALSSEPIVLIADEPTTSLDVTIQAQFLRLLKDLQREHYFSLIFVTHDFGIVARMCDQVAVMYAGRIVEIAPTRELFNNPKHPYAQALLKSVPNPEQEVDRLPSIPGQPPSLLELGPGCPFAPRCPHAMEACQREYPPAVAVGESNHSAACWLYSQERP